VKLCKAGLEDIAALAVMSQALSEASGSAPMSLEKHRDRVGRELETYTTELVLVEGELVGYLVHLSQRDLEDRSMILQIHRLFVKTDQRRKGVGREVVRQLLESYPKGTQIFLAGKLENKTALAFYEALGFNVHLLTMRRVL